jgi:Putative phage tail protein
MAVFTAIGAALFGAGTFLAGLTAAGLQIVAGIAINAIAKSIAGEPQKSRFAVQGQIQGGDDVPRSINLGWNTTAGSLVYQNEWGAIGQTTNAYSTRVIALGDYPIREMTGLFVDGSPVTVLWGEAIAKGAPVQEYRRGGVDHLWVKFYDGTQTAADTFLTGTVSSAERPYTSGRIGYGIPYLIATSLTPEQVDGEDALFNGFPAFKITTYGARLYDVSKDSSVGGSGSQRWNNPATWGGDGDFLPPVQIYNLLRGMRYGGDWLYGLQDLPEARLPAANWIAAINKARATIAGPDGNEATYRAGGELQVGAAINVAIEALLTSCQGRLVEIGGTYKLYLGEPDTAVASFGDGDIISTEEQQFTPFYGLADTINGIQATYPNPAEGWNTKTAPDLRNTDMAAQDGNRRLMASVSLDMVPYGGQVQRLMLSALNEARRARRHTLTLGPEFWPLEPGDIIEWTSERNGYEAKLFRVDGLADKANLDVLIDITEVDPADYDWDQESDYTPVIDGPLTINRPPAQPMTGWNVEGVIIKDELGADRRASVRVSYDGLQSDVTAVRVQVRTSGETLPFFDGQIPYGSPYATVLYGSFPPNTDLEVRGMYVPGSPRATEWSDWLGVRTPDVPEVQPDSIGINELNQDLKLTHGLVNDSSPGTLADRIAQLEVQAEEMAQILAQGDLSNRGEIKVLKAHRNGGLAAVLEERRARVDADVATALLIQQVVAQLNDQFASAFLKFEVLASDELTFASIAIMVRVNSEGTFVESGIRIRVDVVGGIPTAQIALLTQNLVITDGTNSSNAITIDATTGKLRLKELLFERIRSVDGTSIDINGLSPEISLIGS